MGVSPLKRLDNYGSTVSVTMDVTLEKKKRGPAPTGKGTSLHVRLQPPELAMVDEWIAAQSKPMSRPEAIRQMLAERALKPAKS